MSTSVDTRVVEMQFDNASFQKGVAETMTSLEKLSGQLDGKKTFSVLDGLKGALSNIGLESVGNGLDNLFSKASTVFSGLTSMVGSFSKTLIGVSGVASALLGGGALIQAITGGSQRATNIENARFQIQGLGADWEALKDDINYAVDGTAYGFDAAAMAASQLTASGIEAGDAMKKSLRAISGVAAQTNSDYGSIASVFTTVAGQGKLMTMQLRQLEARGLNVAASLGQQLGYSEAEIRDFVSDGKIDFETFANAMDDAFGEHAKKANETFTGAVANMKAALNKIGADFFTPIHELERQTALGFRLFFNSIREGLNQEIPLTKLEDFEGGVKATIGGTYSTISSFTQNMGNLGNDIFNAFEHLYNSGAIQEFVSSFTYLNNALFKGAWLNTSAFITSMFSKLETIDLSGFKDSMRYIGEGLSYFSEKTAAQMPIIVDILGNLAGSFLNVVSAIGSVALPIFEALGDAIAKVFNIEDDGVSGLLKGFLEGSVKLKDFTESLKLSAEQMQTIRDLFSNIFNGILGFADMIAHIPLWQSISQGFQEIGKFFSDMKLFEDFDLFKGGEEKAHNFFGTIQAILAGLGNTVKTALGGIADFVKDTFGSVFGFIIDGFKSMTLSDFLTAGFVGSLSMVLSSLAVTIVEFAKKIKWFNLPDMLGLSSTLTALKNELNSMTAQLKVKSLLGIAAAIGIFAIALKQLSEIDPGSLMNAVLAIGALTAILASAMLALANFTVDPKAFAKIAKIGGTFVALAAGVAILSAAVKALAGLDPASMWMAIGAVAALTAILTASAIALGNLAPRMVRSGIGMIFMANAIMTLSLALKLLSTIPADSMKVALLGFAAAMGVVTAAMILMSQFTKNLPLFAIGIMAMSVAMLALAVSLKILSSIPLNSMGVALLGFAAGFAVMTAAMIAMSRLGGKLLGFTAGMLAMSTTLIALSLSIKLLSTIPLEQMGTALLGLAGAMLIMSVAMIAMSNLGGLTGSIGLLAVAIALMALAPALAMLSAIPLEGIGTALLMLAGTLLVLGAAAYLIPAPLMLALAASLLAISVGILAIGAGVALAGAGLLSFAAALAALSAMGPVAAESIVLTLQTIILGLLSLVGNIAAAIAEGITVFIETLSSNVSRIAEAARSLIKTLLTVLGETIPELVTIGLNMILALLQGLVDNMGAIVQAGLEIVARFLMGVAAGIGQVVDAGAKLVIGFISGVADALRNNVGLLLDAVGNVVHTLFGLIEGLIADGLEAIFGPNPVADWIRENADEQVAEAEAASKRVTEAISAENDKLLANQKTLTDELAKTTEDGGSKMVDASTGVSDNILENLTGNLDQLPPELQGYFSDGISSIEGLTGDASAAGLSLGNASIDGVVQPIEQGGWRAQSAMQGAVDSAKNVDTSGTASIGRNLVEGVIAGIHEKEGSLQVKAAQLINTAVGAMRAAGVIKSPSRKTMEIGGYLTEGLAIGLMEYSYMITNASRNLIDVATQSFAGASLSMGSVIDSIDWNSNPTITPVLDTSLIEQGLNGMDSMFARSYTYPMGMRAFDTRGYSGSFSRITTLNVELNYNAGTDAAAMVNGIVDGLQTALNLEG